MYFASADMFSDRNMKSWGEKSFYNFCTSLDNERQRKVCECRLENLSEIEKSCRELSGMLSYVRSCKRLWFDRFKNYSHTILNFREMKLEKLCLDNDDY